VPAECVPFLRHALAVSGSEVVFPAPDGSMRSRASNLSESLRRTLARAGIVTGYVHVCRKRGCGHSEAAPDRALRRCPVHGDKLWPTAQVRPIHFHHLRHTCGSNLAQQGVAIQAVAAVLGTVT